MRKTFIILIVNNEQKYNLIFFIIILRMSWLLGGVAYDVAKWTVKKGIEGAKEAWRISQNAEANRIRY